MRKDKAKLLKYLITFIYNLKYGYIYINKNFQFRLPFFYFKIEKFKNSNSKSIQFSLIFPTEFQITELEKSISYRFAILGFGFSYLKNMIVNNDQNKVD